MSTTGGWPTTCWPAFWWNAQTRKNSHSIFLPIKGYDYEDVHEAVEELQSIPEAERHPARRRAVERTISWLG